MGCSASVRLKEDPLPKSGGGGEKGEGAVCLYLTAGQKADIRQTWRQVHEKGALTIGKRVFLHIFELKPEVKRHFPFRDAWGDDLLAHAQFRDHVTRFVRTINSVVDNMNDDKGKLSTMMRRLGEVHATGAIIDVTYFDVFTAAILTVLHHELATGFTDDTKTAWNRLLGYVVHQMKDGYKDEMARLEKTTSGSVVDIAITPDATQPEPQNGVHLKRAS